MGAEDILHEIYERFGEHLEMAGDDAPVLVIQIACKMVALEREKNNFNKRLKNVSVMSTNS